ncbi:hypothetical protein [Streptomyces sp. NRRL F-5123]|uniref:hypothetical protein n=1 Tax=Streptomyces sp. NRRL F-5123 TaxID=1463856 RepID=UPI00131E6096|nr:hypothetical protein [Streptomyces sp. NRRL F-5123]
MGVAPLAVVLAVLAVVAGSCAVSSSHEHAARRHLDQRARSYADALAESYARGQTGDAVFKALARSTGGGRLVLLGSAPADGGTVVDFEGDERYSTPGNGYGSSVTVCYRVTLGPSAPRRAPLETRAC